jgi:gamma-glutamyl:cysteine ligase YbdK (ATP-grasp superfamily)
VGHLAPILAPRLRCSGYAFNNADVSKIRTTVTLDDDVLRAVKIKAARSDKRNSQVIEESLRRDLGVDELAEIWAKVTPAAGEKGMEPATDELRAMHREKRDEGGTQAAASSSPR